jgi:biotin operon repressor
MPYRSDGTGFRLTDTSEAAMPSRSKAATLRERVYEALRLHGPMTSDELAEHLGIDRGSVQPRTSELRNAGMVIDSGQRRTLASGKRGIVWRACRSPTETAMDLFDNIIARIGGAR